jgi:hypothetical protein
MIYCIDKMIFHHYWGNAMKKLLRYAICTLLPLCFLASCSSTVSSSAEQAASQPSASPSADESLSYTYSYVKADLLEGKLTVTLLSDEAKKIGLPDGNDNGFSYDTPYTVQNIAGSYTKMYIGTIGQDTAPYLFLLTTDSKVECVPVCLQIFNNTSDSPAFSSIGLLKDISDIVSFKDETITEEDGGGYATVMAVDKKGSEHNLSDAYDQTVKSD